MTAAARTAIRPEVAVLVEAPAWRAVPDVEATVARAALAALDACPDRVSPHSEVAVALLDDAAISALNRGFRGKDGPTNVLSFPARRRSGRRPVLLGDVAVAYETAAAEAAAEAKPLAAHLSHLVVHGVLHLVGYDHGTEREAAEMEGVERIVLAGLGVADPYAQHDAAD